jgi:hypothetical protein
MTPSDKLTSTQSLFILAFSATAGVLAPSVLAGLIGRDFHGKWFYVPIAYLCYCVARMLSLLFIRETRDINLHTLDHHELAPALAAAPGLSTSQLAGDFHGSKR